MYIDLLQSKVELGSISLPHPISVVIPIPRLWGEKPHLLPGESVLPRALSGPSHAVRPLRCTGRRSSQFVVRDVGSRGIAIEHCRL